MCQSRMARRFSAFVRTRRRRLALDADSIAGSILTVAALAFSLTLNAVTQASGQFTPRIFRNFMRDRANQLVLGYFVSVFAFCLLVLRTIRGADELKFVPSFAVLTGRAGAGARRHSRADFLYPLHR